MDNLLHRTAASTALLYTPPFHIHTQLPCGQSLHTLQIHRRKKRDNQLKNVHHQLRRRLPGCRGHGRPGTRPHQGPAVRSAHQPARCRGSQDERQASRGPVRQWLRSPALVRIAAVGKGGRATLAREARVGNEVDSDDGWTGGEEPRELRSTS